MQAAAPANAFGLTTSSTHKLRTRAIALATSGDSLYQRLTELLGPPEPLAVLEERLRFTPTSESGNLNFAINTVEFVLHSGIGNSFLTVTYVGAAHGGKESGVVSVLESEASTDFRDFLLFSGFRPVADLLKKGWRFSKGRLGFEVLLYQPTNVLVQQTQSSTDAFAGGLTEGPPVFSQALVLEIEVTGEGERFEERKKRAETWFAENLKNLCSTELTIVKS